jgi:hypothetical protein
MQTKHFDKFLQLIDELKKTTGINKAGNTFANAKVDDDKFIKPSSWNAPSSSEENAYIEKNGIEAFGKWHLGIDANVDPETKGHWHYIITSDFVNVDRAGLIATRQRAGQQKETAIFEAAGKLIAKIDA